MKLRLFTLLALVILGSTVMAAPPEHRVNKEAPRSAQTTDYRAYIDANSIFMFITNVGNFGRDLAGVFGYDYGTFFPYNGIEFIEDGSQTASPLYASGLWIGAVDSATGDVRVKVSEYNSEYQVGPWYTGAFVDNDRYRVYKLYSDSAVDNPSQDWTDWPIDLGAPVRVDTVTETTIVEGPPPDTTITIVSIDTLPGLIGDQTTWSVFNDADTSLNNDAGNTASMGLEIRQTTFAFNREGPLGSIIFFRFQVYNKGVNTLLNTYFSLWLDPDLGGAGDDLVGCDVPLSMGYVYNSDNDDLFYLNQPPALGYDFFQGPLVETGDEADTAKAWGQRWPGYRNLPMASFNKYINGTDPGDSLETYNYMLGLNADGSNPGTPFQVSGDPVTNSGALDVAPADRRMMLSTGPITFRPGDSTEIVAAVIVARTNDRKTSISLLRYYDQFAQTAYDNDFQIPTPPAPPNLTITTEDEALLLRWDNTSEVKHGDYPFEGYTVLQGESPSGPWVRIANFDVTNGEAKIFEEVFDPVQGVLENRLVRNGSDNGIQRFFRVTTDEITGQPIDNIRQYYFRVEAYTYDPNNVPKLLSSNSSQAVRPQTPVLGREFPSSLGDSLIVTRLAGASEGTVRVEVIDPSQVTGHGYRLEFVDTTAEWMNPNTGEVLSVNAYWRLIDTTTGDTVLDKQFDQTGTTSSLIADGLLLKVAGPAVDFKNFTVVANASGVLATPQGGAATFQGFPAPADPDDDQQVGAGVWLIHTGDNGGTNNGGTRGPYSAFYSRATRDGANFVEIGAFDFEVRFTGSYDNPGIEGGWAWNYFGDEAFYWVPFELWNIGSGTPDDPSDDYRLVPWLLEIDSDNQFDMHNFGADPTTTDTNGLEHSVSGGDNDPYTGWIYWYRPDNNTPGEAGYLAAEAEMIAGTYTGDREHEVLARQVFVNWNGGAAPPFNQDLPEQGTVFRMETTKPHSSRDTFAFGTPAPTMAKSEQLLDQVSVVPNPFYLYSDYDTNPTAKLLAFQNLPATCTISIYNLAGDFIVRLEKDDASTSLAYWDLLTTNRLPVASGIYIYVLEAPGYGQKIGKFAVLGEVEVLRQY